MASIDAIRKQLALLEDGFDSKNGFSQVQVQLAVDELSNSEFDDVDLENAVYKFIKIRSGGQKLPSIDAICAEVELQRERRLQSQRFVQTEHVIEEAASVVNNPLYKLHAKAICMKIQRGFRTPLEIDSPEAEKFREVVEELIASVDFAEISKTDFNQFDATGFPFLETEFRIVAECARKHVEELDPFADI